MVLSVILPLPLDEPGERAPRGAAVRLRARPQAIRIRRRLPEAGDRRNWVLEVEVDVAVPDPEELLLASPDFLVDTADGELGVVEEVEVASGGGVAALLVAGGRFGRRRIRVPVEDVETILPAERRIVVRA